MVNKEIKIMVCSIMVLTLFLVGCQYELEESYGDRALMNVEGTSGFINELNDDEYFFDYWLINYGKQEAKNIVVECIVYGEGYIEIEKFTEDVGNIASLSSEIKEMVVDNPNIEEGDIGTNTCAIKYCENCDILRDRLLE